MKRPRIDKSVLAIGCPQRIVDTAYRQSFKHSVCIASRNGTDLCMAPAIGAHIRSGEYSGGAQKPTDLLIIPLCSDCHRDQEEFKGPQAEWFLENVLKPQLRRRYRRWKNGLPPDPENMFEEAIHDNR